MRHPVWCSILIPCLLNHESDIGSSLVHRIYAGTQEETQYSPVAYQSCLDNQRDAWYDQRVLKKAHERPLKVGDIIEVIHYTPGRYAPGVKDELGTENLFRRIVGHRFRVMGFDEYGHIELHPTRKDHIWIKPEDVALASRKAKKS